MSERLVCGFGHPPPDGTHDREVIDRMIDFMRAAGPAVTKKQIDSGETKWRTPAGRYNLRFLAWRVGQVPHG
jgi:hypothetical protein